MIQVVLDNGRFEITECPEARLGGLLAKDITGRLGARDHFRDIVEVTSYKTMRTHPSVDVED